MRRSHALVLGVVVAGAAAAVAIAAPGGSSGPSSSQPPYLVRSQPGVVLKSILTVGDTAPNGYRMVGIPDGLGTFDNGDGTFTVLMNHELGSGVGAVRAHGAKGAFVSRWVIRKDDLAVVSGRDLIQTLNITTGTKALNRLCSADLAPLSAFWTGSKGYDGRIFLDGEEGGTEGRAFAHFATGPEEGTSYELPALGKFAWENVVAHPDTGDKTVVVGTDDGAGGQVYVYVGQKSATGTAVERAGLKGGKLYGIKVAGLNAETDTVAPISAAFTGFDLGDVSGKTGAEIEAASQAVVGGSRVVTTFQRPEDGSWDPTSPNDFYFVTTASFTGQSRLWRLRFDDPANPAAGGTITQLLSSADGPRMMDNITVNGRGQIVIQEDIGNQDALGKVWLYTIASGSLVKVAEHDPERFAPGAPGFLTRDEESSGVIPAGEVLGEGWYLADVQAHYANADPELVEGGQLLALHVPPGKFK